MRFKRRAQSPACAIDSKLESERESSAEVASPSPCVPGMLPIGAAAVHTRVSREREKEGHKPEGREHQQRAEDECIPACSRAPQRPSLLQRRVYMYIRIYKLGRALVIRARREEKGVYAQAREASTITLIIRRKGTF